MLTQRRVGEVVHVDPLRITLGAPVPATVGVEADHLLLTSRLVLWRILSAIFLPLMFLVVIEVLVR